MTVLMIRMILTIAKMKTTTTMVTESMTVRKLRTGMIIPTSTIMTTTVSTMQLT